MAGGEITKTFPYSPRTTKPPARKCRDHWGLVVRTVSETRERQFLVRGLPAEQGWVPSSISVFITHPVREVRAFRLMIFD
jgi:hypothetical protein